MDPVASMRITNSNILLEVPSSLSKKMPPRKGLKNLSIIVSEKPSAWDKQQYKRGLIEILLVDCVNRWYVKSEGSQDVQLSFQNHALPVTGPEGKQVLVRVWPEKHDKSSQGPHYQQGL